MDVLRLKRMEFHGRHGTEPWERETGCRFTVDLELKTELGRAGRTDRLEDALDYRVIFARTRHVVENESHNLIETVAERLAQEILRTFPVDEVTVRVGKPEARIGGLNQAVEVELTRTRAAYIDDARETRDANRASPPPRANE